jgi:hypothetical protein
MTNKQQLLQSINETEQQLEKLKQELEAHKTPTIQGASVGDTLEDGSIVLMKENHIALLIAPKSTEVYCKWTKGFPEVYSKLTEQGFIPSQWFVPTVEQLRLAYKVIPNEFNEDWYWSSSEFDAFSACFVSSCNGIQSNCSSKSNTNCVRSVRCVSY